MSTAADKANLARIRDNQRRSRARRKDYLSELEGRVRSCELQGVEATSEIQLAARNVADENKKLRALLHQNGVGNDVIESFLQNMRIDAVPHIASNVVHNLETAMLPRKCGATQSCGVPLDDNSDTISKTWSGAPYQQANDGLSYSPSSQHVYPYPSAQGTPNSGRIPAMAGSSSVPRPTSGQAKQRQMNRLSGISDAANYHASRASLVMASEDFTFDNSPAYSNKQHPISYWQPGLSPTVQAQSQTVRMPHPYQMQDMNRHQFSHPPEPSHPPTHNQIFTSPQPPIYAQNLIGPHVQGLDMSENEPQASSCVVATDLITSMSGSDPTVVRRELGCGPMRDCQVNNQLVFNVMDRMQGASPNM